MQPNDITFFQRFQDDILAGRKPSPSATSLNRTSKRVMCFVSDGLKMTVIFARLKLPQPQP